MVTMSKRHPGVLTGKAGVGVWGPRNVSILIWPEPCSGPTCKHS